MDIYSCSFCNSKNIYVFNTYKHYCITCYDCNNVSHIKKKKYLLEYILPRSIFKKLLPEKAFLRLFSDKKDFDKGKFYNKSYINEISEIDNVRKSEFDQLTDLLNYFNYDIKNKRILDISGAPGYVGYRFNKMGIDCEITEFSERTVDEIKKRFKIPVTKFDYNNDNLEEVINSKFDLILLRSSIIFCEDIDTLLLSLNKILNKNGSILVESIIPTMGEILWWQTLEYKFSKIPSQEYLEKIFYKYGFNFIGGTREYGNYLGVKSRSYSGYSKNFFVWFVDYPLVLLYKIFIRHNKVPIDQSMKHKMLFQFWSKKRLNENRKRNFYSNFNIGVKNKSVHFGFPYNNYLKNKKFND